MNQRVGWPVLVLVAVLLAGGIYMYAKKIMSLGPTPVDTAANVPPRQPGDDKPAQPPPGMVVPGTIKR